jgi:hypothetical protein
VVDVEAFCQICNGGYLWRLTKKSEVAPGNSFRAAYSTAMSKTPRNGDGL